MIWLINNSYIQYIPSNLLFSLLEISLWSPSNSSYLLLTFLILIIYTYISTTYLMLLLFLTLSNQLSPLSVVIPIVKLFSILTLYYTPYEIIYLLCISDNIISLSFVSSVLEKRLTLVFAWDPCTKENKLFAQCIGPGTSPCTSY